MITQFPVRPARTAAPSFLDAHVETRPRRRLLRSARLAALIAAMWPVALLSQQTQLDVHGNYSTGTSTHAKSWGAGAGVQVTFGGKSSAIMLSASPGVDYLKQEQGGPSQTSVSLDVSLQPGGNSTVTPYAGASAGANWSGGSSRQWDGSKLGLETLAGVQVKLGGSSITAKAEERFGYVKGEEHTLTTRVGLLLSM